jgi:ABC-type polysaccharide/polyol phosphate transport system ATPase subunit
MSSKPAVSVNAVSKTYRVYSHPHHRVQQWWADKRGTGKLYCHEVNALQGVTFNVSSGESIAIIGRNGSGKSTLLQMITGNLAVTTGSIDVSGSVSALLELGAGFNPDFSGRENLRLNAAIRGLSPEETAALEPAIEKFADIGSFIDEPVRTYSSGMYVRLAFAVAIHIVPDILIIDEALAVGDIFFQQKCYDHIANSMQDATKILVTHDLASITRLANRCLVIDSGKLIFDGSPLEAIEIYTSKSLGERAARDSAGMYESADFDSQIESYTENYKDQNWYPILTDNRTTNPSNFLINAISGRSLGSKPRKLESDSWVLDSGEVLQMMVDFNLGCTVNDPIIGYLVRDRVGNTVFGMNTVTQGIQINELHPGRYIVRFEATWPELEPGEFNLTIGIGDGKHGLHHHIVGWVQSVASVVSVPKREVHGLFNGDLSEFKILKFDSTEIQ